MKANRWQRSAGWLKDALQLVTWLLFQPTKWREHVESIDPNLTPDFNLLQLGTAHWKNPRLQKTLFIGFLLLPLIAIAFDFLRIFLWDYPRGEICQPWGEIVLIEFNKLGGIYEIGGIMSVMGSFAGGALAGPAHIFAYPFVLALYSRHSKDLTDYLQGGYGNDSGISSIGVIAFAVCLSYSIQARLVLYQRLRGLLSVRFLGGCLLGPVASVFLVLGVDFLRETKRDTALDILSILVLSGYLALIQHGRRRMLRLATSFSLVTATFLLVTLATGIVNWIASKASLAQELFKALVPSFQLISWLLLFVPIGLSGWLGGPLALAVAGMLSGGLGLVWMACKGFSASLTVDEYHRFATLIQLTLYVGFAASVLGFILPWIQSYLLYPLQIAWNHLGYYIDLRGSRKDDKLLRRNAAFWDETQTLRLRGLDAHLVLVAERNPMLARQAITALALGPQRWAAQVAQLELDARMLEGCLGIANIAEIGIELEIVETNNEGQQVLTVFKSLSKDVAIVLRQQNPYYRHSLTVSLLGRLQGLSRDLERMGTDVSQRFLRAVMRWGDILEQEIELLCSEIASSKYIQDPYIVGKPLDRESPQHIFVGRRDVAAQIERFVMSPDRAPLLLFGPRRMGKTSLLNHLAQLLPSSVVPLFVDLQGPGSSTKTPEGFLNYLGHEMARQALDRSVAIQPLAEEVLRVDPFVMFGRWLNDLESRLLDRTAILLLDEFEQMEDLLSGKDALDPREILGLFRHISQHSKRIGILLAGSHSIDEMTLWSRYLVNVRTIRLGALRREEALCLIEHPIEKFALSYDRDAIDRLIQLSGCHPCLLQMLCSQIIERKNKQPVGGRYRATLTDVNSVIDDALDQWRFLFSDIQRYQIDARGRYLLVKLALRGTGSILRPADDASCFESSDHAVWRALRNRDLVEPVDAGYRFCSDLVRHWFATRAVSGI